MFLIMPCENASVCLFPIRYGTHFVFLFQSEQICSSFDTKTARFFRFCCRIYEISYQFLQRMSKYKQNECLQ